MLAGVIGSAEIAELAGRHAEQQLAWRVADLDRLAAVADGARSGELTVLAAFRPAAEGLARLDLSIHGTLVLTCQRCLGDLVWPVDLSAEFCIVASDDDAGRLREPIDAVAPGPEGLSLAELTEDEVLAALPLAPMHAAGAGCTAGEPASVPDGPNRPLAGLAALLKKDADDPVGGR
jgi:uncharacterized protein